MKFHNRAFPYPVLDGSDGSRDDYVDGGYQATLTHSDIEPDGYITFTVNYLCSVDELKLLVVNRKAKYGILITCSATGFRRFYATENISQIIQIKAKYFFGRVEFWPQIVTTESVEGYSSELLNEEYADFAFDLEPGDVLASDDSIVKYFEFDQLNFESLVSARRSDEINPYSYNINLQERSIFIDMGVKLYELFSNLRADRSKLPFLAMSIYKDCFFFALTELISNQESTEYRWARALEKKLGEMHLALPQDDSPNEVNALAQKLLEDFGVKKLIALQGERA